MIIICSRSLAEAVGEGRESGQERGRVGNLGIYIYRHHPQSNWGSLFCVIHDRQIHSTIIYISSSLSLHHHIIATIIIIIMIVIIIIITTIIIILIIIMTNLASVNCFSFLACHQAQILLASLKSSLSS